MAKLPAISDAEWDVMKVLWGARAGRRARRSPRAGGGTQLAPSDRKDSAESPGEKGRRCLRRGRTPIYLSPPGGA